MHEIIEAFGIDWRLIVIQVFNFGILVGVLWYFLYTPILRLLSDREERLRKGIEDADRAAVEREKAEADRNEVLRKAQEEASHIVVRGKEHAEEKARELLDETAERISREIQNAKLSAEEIKAKSRKESEAEIARLAILGAEQILRERK